MKAIAAALRLLGDETRLRALRLLRREELNAGELARILGLASSAVSRQMAILREAELVDERRVGRFAFFRAATDAASLDGLFALLGDRVDEADDTHGDLARLQDVLRTRRERRMAGTGAQRPYVPGRSWASWARVVGMLVPGGLRAADLGCGDGALALEIARFAETVVGVDRRKALVTRARAAAKKAGAANVKFRVADIEALPLDDGAFDAALLSQSLHATEEPVAALREAVRVLAPGGRLLVMEVLPHDEAWVRERLGHTRQGFGASELESMLRDAGLDGVTVASMPARDGDAFRPVIASGTISGGAATARLRRRNSGVAR